MTRPITTRVEQLIARVPPGINCTLFFAGFYLGVTFLLAHLSWYGLPRSAPGWPSESNRMLLKMAIFVTLAVAVAAVTPGSLHRRLFSACTFPLLALLAMLVSHGCLSLVSVLLGSQDHGLFVALIQGVVLGAFMAGILSLPVALLFRSSSVPAALLAALPALAKEDSSSGHFATLLCEVLVIAAAAYTVRRYLLPAPNLDGSVD